MGHPVRERVYVKFCFFCVKLLFNFRLLYYYPHLSELHDNWQSYFRTIYIQRATITTATLTTLDSTHHRSQKLTQTMSLSKARSFARLSVATIGVCGGGVVGCI